MILIATVLLLGAAGAGTAQTTGQPGAGGAADGTAGDQTDADGQGNWLGRYLQRYFGNDSSAGAPPAGRAVEMVGRYAAHVGKTIEVVIVSQVARFEDDWDQGKGSGQLVLNTVTKPFQTYTRDSTIRQYLLFAPGDAVDPFLIADTERLLRALDYIEDVRISVVPLSGSDGQAGGSENVAIVVETRDRWPFGASAVLKDVGHYEASLYSSNVGGIGLRWDNQLVWRDDRDRRTGYRGVLRKDNLGGSFIAAEAEFEDTYRRLRKGGGFVKDLAHPAVQWVGGTSWYHDQERDAGPDPDEHEIGDVWVGDVIPLRARQGATSRPVLVPAVSFNRKTFLDRPAVSRDTLREFHNAQNYLVGVSFQNYKYYKTSYLFEMGETENLPSGVAVRVSGGYQDGEYHDRGQAWFASSLLSARNRGDIVHLTANVGGFYRDRVFEDGSLVLGAAYVSPLNGDGSWHHRLHVQTYYHLAMNRSGSEALYLGNATGLRGMEDRRVAGNQRLLGTIEFRLFPPWSVMGFRFMLMGFVDGGAVAGEEEAILKARIYGSGGIAVRIRNPELVLPPLQLRVAFLNSIDDKGVRVGFRVGGPDSPEIRLPGIKPGGFEFR